MRKWFFKLTLRTKLITPIERALKIVPKSGIRSCVHFCLRSLGPLERCDLKNTNMDDNVTQWMALFEHPVSTQIDFAVNEMPN